MVYVREEHDEYTYDWDSSTYDDEDKKILKITKSSAMTFNWCPRKYQFNYPLNLPQDQTPAMAKGSIIHNAVENYWNEFDIIKAEKMDRTQLLNYSNSLFPIDDYADMYHTISAFQTERFFTAKENDTLDEYCPIGNEIKLNARYMIMRNQDPKFPLTRDYEVHLQGIIDRLFLENGGYIPMELKTGLWKDYQTTNMRKESAFYKLLIEQSDDEQLRELGLDPAIPVTHWGWYYPASNHIYIEKQKQSSTTALLKGIARLIYSYENAHFETKYYHKTCSHCSYVGICDAAQKDTWL
tara:strand:+ start:7585 stop:8472 length:888 start_codon:yes stop_codon:yes gene_type:complete